MKIRRDKRDAKWAEIVRERDGRCRKCGKTNALNAHHIMPRGRWATRLDPDNGLTLCAGCHVFSPDSVHRSPDGSKKFCIKIIGSQEYKRLEKKSNTTMPKREALRIFDELIKNGQLG